MTNKKYCPLSFCRHGPLEYCLKERCAWYDKLEKKCAIWLIAHQLRRIYWQLEDGVTVIKP